MGAIKKADKGSSSSAGSSVAPLEGDSTTQGKVHAKTKDSKIDKIDNPVGAGPPRRSCAALSEKPLQHGLHRQLHKTKFCIYHLQGVCEFGDNCAFAHNCVELQGIPDLRKTRLCKAYANGNCKDVNCSFAHSEEELRSTDLFYKKTLCMWYEKGRCRNGSQCRFAHGVEELQSWPLPTGELSGGTPNKRGGKTIGKSVNNPRAGADAGTGAKQESLTSEGPPDAAASVVGADFNSRSVPIDLAYAHGAGAVAAPPAALPTAQAPARAAPHSMRPPRNGFAPSPMTGFGDLAMNLSAFQPPQPPQMPAQQPPPGLDTLRSSEQPSNTRSNLEPMFVNTVPSPPPPVAAQRDNMAVEQALAELSNQQRQMECLQRSLAATVDTELLRRYERQMGGQLQGVSPLAAVAAVNNRIEEARGMALQAELEKLTQNIATLSMQLSRFESQMHMRAPLPNAAPMSQALLQQAHALAQQTMMFPGASGQEVRTEVNGNLMNQYNRASLASPPMSQLAGLTPGLFRA